MQETVLITGVSSGTGLGLATRFIDEGYRVAGSVRTHDKAAELKSTFGQDFIPLVFDVTEPDQIASAARQLRDEYGVEHLSAMVNNAGWAKLGPLLHVPINEFRANLEVLVVGQLAVIQGFFGFLMPGDTSPEPGRIFNITSVSGVGPNFLFGGYAAGKHALEGLSKTLRLECARYGIKVIVVAPGNIATAIWDKQTDAVIEKYRNTDYFAALQAKISEIGSGVVRQAMSVEEFSSAFFDVFTDARPANRYTIDRSKNGRNPFSKVKVRIRRS
jgi:NAD(P)-dependent dehydrogenase (short-subunit alcohol dehydrogenase family)